MHPTRLSKICTDRSLPPYGRRKDQQASKLAKLRVNLFSGRQGLFTSLVLRLKIYVLKEQLWKVVTTAGTYNEALTVCYLALRESFKVLPQPAHTMQPLWLGGGSDSFAALSQS